MHRNRQIQVQHATASKQIFRNKLQMYTSPASQDTVEGNEEYETIELSYFHSYKFSAFFLLTTEPRDTCLC